MEKTQLFQTIDAALEKLTELAWQIYDHPETGGQEHFAVRLLTQAIAAEGFSVDKGVAGLQTAFRATWSSGHGGPHIGILAEYDALEQIGHGCAHHLQAPAAIGAAVAIKQAFQERDIPFTITVFGTPAEETFGGKTVMAEKGAFRELDIALATHACSADAFVAGPSMALVSFLVEFHGVSAHASARPYEGKSAADAMLLAFNGVEFLREHVPDGTRIQYTITQALPPSNVVPAVAKAGFTLRHPDQRCLPDLERRLRNIIQGACLMTDTTATVTRESAYQARKVNETLAALAVENWERLGIAHHKETRPSKGASDFGNVSRLLPGVMLDLTYCEGLSHSRTWVEQGKGEKAVKCLADSAKTLAGMIFDLVTRPELVEQAKEEFGQS